MKRNINGVEHDKRRSILAGKLIEQASRACGLCQNATVACGVLEAGAGKTAPESADHSCDKSSLQCKAVNMGAV